jgi:hypothetical protein
VGPWPVWTSAENIIPTGIRSADRPARSYSLYRLSYPSPHYAPVVFLNIKMGLGWQLHLRPRPKNSCSTSLFAGRFGVGQNVFQTSSWGARPNGNQDWKAAVQAWYDEVKDYSRNDIKPFRSVQQQSCPCDSLTVAA